MLQQSFDTAKKTAACTNQAARAMTMQQLGASQVANHSFARQVEGLQADKEAALSVIANQMQHWQARCALVTSPTHQHACLPCCYD